MNEYLFFLISIACLSQCLGEKPMSPTPSPAAIRTLSITPTPSPISSRTTSSTTSSTPLSADQENARFDFILQETKLLTLDVKTLIDKTLAQLPKDSDYDFHRNRCREYLELYRQYQLATSDDCGEKALEFYDFQNTFLKFYLGENIKALRSQEMVQLLNRNGMQDIIHKIHAKRSELSIGNTNWNKFFGYMAVGHC
uniref:Uncharacterized protein n=1 Tax=Stomoxys calcitrans TaxID=35570 RepID=A0A1I8PVW3_STOCA